MHWRKLLKIIETPFSFLFLGSKGEAKFKLAGQCRSFERAEEVYLAKINYEIQIRRRFGLGFLMSFIPGAVAFRARLDYLNCALACDEHSLLSLQEEDCEFYFPNLALAAVCSPLYFFSKFLRLWDFTLKPVENPFDDDQNAELLNLIPGAEVIQGSFWLFIIAFALNYCTNPLNVFYIFLSIVHGSLNALIENYLPVSVLKAKIILATLFIPLRLIFATLSAAIASFWAVVAFLTVEPAKFIFTSIKQTIQYWNEDWEREILVTNNSELCNIKIIRKMHKALREDERSMREHGPEAVSKVKAYKDVGNYWTFINALGKAENHKTLYLSPSKRAALFNRETTTVILAVTPAKAEEFKEYQSFYREKAQSFFRYRSMGDQAVLQDIEEKYRSSTDHKNATA